MQIEILKVGDVDLDPDNTREHTVDGIRAIRTSLDRYGQLKPIVVDRERMIVIAGNGTLTAARELGWEEIAVVYADELSPEEVERFSILDNRSAELSRWDLEQLGRVLKRHPEEEREAMGFQQHQWEPLIHAEWTPQEISDEQFTNEKKVSIRLTESEAELLEPMFAMARTRLNKKVVTDGECLILVAEEWLTSQEVGE
jgi:hypothetical protein